MDLIVKIKFGLAFVRPNTPTSDLDYKAILRPRGERHHSFSAFRTPFIHEVGQKSGVNANLSTDVDTETFSLAALSSVAGRGQTGALDMLFAPESSNRSNATADLCEYYPSQSLSTADQAQCGLCWLLPHAGE